VGRKCSIRQGNNDPRRFYTKIILNPEEQEKKKNGEKIIKFGR